MYPDTPKRKTRRGELIKVGDLFEKYKKSLKAPESTVVKEVVEVIADLTGVTLERRYLKYSVVHKTISITAPSILKQEIKLHQTEIILHLKARLGERQAPKVLF
jgi:hypothetical protein